MRTLGIASTCAAAVAGATLAAASPAHGSRAVEARWVTPASANAKRFPEGIFRYTVVKADILHLVPAATPNQIQGMKGTFTWTFRNGTVTMAQVGGGWGYADTHWRGRYVVRPGRLVIRWSACPGCPSVETVLWRWDGKMLHLAADAAHQDAGSTLVWNVKPWVKIG
jgi:hypothetical protein